MGYASFSYRLSATRDIQFLEDAFKVIFHRIGADVQDHADLKIGFATAHPMQDFLLAV